MRRLDIIVLGTIESAHGTTLIVVFAPFHALKKCIYDPFFFPSATSFITVLTQALRVLMLVTVRPLGPAAVGQNSWTSRLKGLVLAMAANKSEYLS